MKGYNRLMKQVEARLMLGDCHAELKKLKSNSVDLIFYITAVR
jgi:DNA modification methylase